MMARKFSWIALFVTLQISAVLCRTTGKPDEEDKTIHQGPILFSHGHVAVAKPIAEYFSDNLGESTNKSASPSKMPYNFNFDENTYAHRAAMSAAAIFGILFGIFCLLSLIIGVVICCVKKEIRRPGFIVNSSTGGLIAGMHQPPPAGFIQPMEQYPPPYGQAQHPIMYPPVHTSN